MQQDCLEKYELIYQLLGAWFPEIDYEDKSFKEVIQDYKKVSSKRLPALKVEFGNLFKNRDVDYESVSEHSNIYLENDEEMYEWLHELYGYLFEDE